MNFAVFGLDNTVISYNKNKPEIIFSTFANYEIFYLKMMEISPADISNIFSECALLIDEADSILVDEITNGTVISREIRSNSTNILKFVYNQKKKNVSPEITYRDIKEKWPNCVDLKIKDVERMYNEIDIINQEEFTNGKKYSIETIAIKNDKKRKRLCKEALNLVKNIAVKTAKGLVKEFSSKKDENDEDDDDSDDNEIEDEGEDEEESDEPVTYFKKIVPFDYDHKGILEPNKEFSGFIQQFIAIKESEKEENKNMLINKMSLNFMYISHPTFVNLYTKVFGFTGTIGSKKEKKIYKEQYQISTKKIPRNDPNQRVELPIILCNSLEERNKTIVFEILQFHEQNNPVLVICQALTDIDDIARLLYNEGINCINIFDGKKGIIQPDKIAGIPGAITLGTNVCGRGTNILVREKPLHVIVSYYSINSRVMNQAHGRTARQGMQGTSRIICVKEQFLYPKLLNNNDLDSVVNEFSIKNEAQKKFIINYKDKNPWIFYDFNHDGKFSEEDIKVLRKARINVNRIVAYNAEFPLKMSIKTFLKIQSQRIFSIFNCPNSKFTMKLFIKYVKETIFEVWSLMINEFDEEFFDLEENQEYKKELEKLKDLHLNIYLYEYQSKRNQLSKKFSLNIKTYQQKLDVNINSLNDQIAEYLPESINPISSFMLIFKKVVNEYEDKILGSFGKKSKFFYQSKNKFLKLQIGFKLYSLITKSGARISYENFEKTNYIKDPEIKYMKKTLKNRFTLMSITQKIDDIFNLIFQKVNEVIGNKTFMKFFFEKNSCWL